MEEIKGFEVRQEIFSVLNRILEIASSLRH